MLFTIEYSMNNQLYPCCFDLDLENLISSSWAICPSNLVEIHARI